MPQSKEYKIRNGRSNTHVKYDKQTINPSRDHSTKSITRNIESYHIELSLLYDELMLFVFMYRLLDYYICLRCALCYYTFVSQMRFTLTCSIFFITAVFASVCDKSSKFVSVSTKSIAQILKFYSDFLIFGLELLFGILCSVNVKIIISKIFEKHLSFSCTFCFLCTIELHWMFYSGCVACRVVISGV